MRVLRGKDLVKRRLRSVGVLSSEEIVVCAEHGAELGYDPVQHGLVCLDCVDDISPVAVEKSKTSGQLRGEVDRFSFRRWSLDDASAFLELLGNPRVWTYLPDAPHGGLDLAKATDLIRFSNEAEHHEVFAVQLDGEIVGQVRLLFDPLAFDRSIAEISYWFGEDYWGRGLGSRVVTSFTISGFSKWPALNSIFARVHCDNIASQRVLMKSGYESESEATVSDWRTFSIRRRNRHSHAISSGMEFGPPRQPHDRRHSCRREL